MRLVILLVLGLSLSGCHLAFQDTHENYYGVGDGGTSEDGASEGTNSGVTSNGSRGGRQARRGGGGRRHARRGPRGRRHWYRGGWRRGWRRGRRH